MKRLSLLVLLAACDSAVVAGSPDAAAPPFDPGSASVTAEPPPDGPDFVCLSHQPPTVALDPLTIAGTVETITPTGALQPVDGASLAFFVAGKPVVLARAQSDAAGAFSTGAVASGGHPLHAYLKATKPGYRTTFLYPPLPFTKDTMTVPLPMMSDALFATIASTLAASQDDHHNGVLLVAVADCKGHLLPGATLSVTRGNGHVAVGDIHDLGAAVAGAGGLFLVFDVPDGKVEVSAAYGGMPLPEHDVMVRKQDPDCPTARSTLTATAVMPEP